MTIPDYQTLMLPVLEVASIGETRVPLAADIIADRLGLSDSDREEMLPSGKQRLLHNRVHWAKFYLTKAGLLQSPRRGIFTTSDAGMELLKQAPSRIDVELLKQYPQFADFYASSTTEVDLGEGQAATCATASNATPEEQIDAAHAVLNAALRAELLGRVLEQSPAFFERVIVELLVAMGYGGSHDDAARRLGKSGDGGIDGVIDEDRLGLDRIYVQAKRFAPGNGVGRPEIQGFVGSLVGLGASKGVFVTTSGFTKQAVDYAIDGERLTELMVEFGVGVRSARIVEVKRLDEEFFGDFA